MEKKYIIELSELIKKQGTPTVNLEIPDGTIKIKDCACWNETNLRTITIPASVTEIGDYAFAGCAGLKRFFVSPDNACFCTDQLGVLYNKEMTELIAFPAALQPLPDKDEDGMQWVQTYDIPEGILRIRPGACIGSRNVQDFRLPSSLIEIGDYAFAIGESLEEAPYIRENVTIIGEGIFDLCPVMGPIHVHKENQQFCTVWGGLSAKDESRLIRVSEGQSGELYISKFLRTIDQGAFAGCADLEEVYCPKALIPKVKKALLECTKMPKLISI